MARRIDRVPHSQADHIGVATRISCCRYRGLASVYRWFVLQALLCSCMGLEHGHMQLIENMARQHKEFESEFNPSKKVGVEMLVGVNQEKTGATSVEYLT